MMQGHPFFSQPQIFYGNPVEEEDEDESALEDAWIYTLGENPIQQTDNIGLFIFWAESIPPEDYS